MLACLRMRELTYRERLVLAAIAYHDGPGRAWPSLQTLADECGMHRSRVAEAVASLCEKGRLIRTHGRTTNFYTPIYADCPEKADREKPVENLCKPCVLDPKSVSGFSGFDCPENPDTNRKELEKVVVKGATNMDESRKKQGQEPTAAKARRGSNEGDQQPGLLAMPEKTDAEIIATLQADVADRDGKIEALEERYAIMEEASGDPKLREAMQKINNQTEFIRTQKAQIGSLQSKRAELQRENKSLKRKVKDLEAQARQQAPYM